MKEINDKALKSMKTKIKIETSVTGKSLSIYVDSRRKVNKLMISLMDAGFTVDYEPRNKAGNYEGCFLCGDRTVIKICFREQKK